MPLPDTDPSTACDMSRPDDAGFSTAELLGNAAMGIAALAVIWTGLEQMGVDVLTQMRAALGL